MNKKINILVYAPSPAITSGISTLTFNLLKPLTQDKRFQVAVYGIKDRGNHKDTSLFPYPIYSFADASDQDIYHRNHFAEVVQGFESTLTPPWDIILVIQHPSILHQPIQANRDGVMAFLRSLQKDTYIQKLPEHWFKSIGVFPLDVSAPIGWIQDVIAITDTPVMVSDFGVSQIEKHMPGILPAVKKITPPVNDTHFFPKEASKSKLFRSQYFRGQVDESTFLITTIAKNYHLNDIPRTLQIYKEFKKIHRNSYLYIHTSPSGPFIDILKIANQLDLEPVEDFAYPGHLTHHHQDSHNMINNIINISDCILSTTQGTWWGMHLMEAMLTKTPVVAPSIYSIPELLNTPHATKLPKKMPNKHSYRGIPLKSGTTPSLYTSWGQGDHSAIRPLVDISDAVEKLLWIVNNPDKLDAIIKRAHKWAVAHTIENQSKSWIDIILDTHQALEKERLHPRKVFEKLGA